MTVFKHLERDSLFASTCTAFIAYAGLVSLSILPLFLSALVNLLGLSADAAGLVVSANLLGAALGLLLVSWCLGRVSLIAVAVGGASLSLLVELFCLIQLPTEGLSVIRLLAGVGNGCLIGVAYNWFAGQKSPDRGFALALLVQFAVGALLIYGLSPWLAQMGISAIYTVFSVFLVLALLLSPVLQIKAVELSAQSLGQGVVCEEGRVSSFMRFRSMALIGLAVMALGIYETVNTGLWAYLEKLGADWLIGTADITLVLSLSSLMGILGALMVMRLQARWGRLIPVIMGLGVAAILLLVLALSQPDLSVYRVCALLFNFCWSFTLPYLQGVLSQLDTDGRMVVIGGLVVLLGIALGPVMFGWGYAIFGLSATLIVGGCFLLLCLLMLVPATLRTDRRQQKLLPVDMKAEAVI